MKRSAFTLIELLVVIAIIAILAAILFPVFAQAKAAAKATASLSNIKQQSLGILMYANDNDDHFVPEASWNNGNDPLNLGGVGTVSTWAWLDLPYIKNGPIFQDPSGPNTPDWLGQASGTNDQLASDTVIPEYGYNDVFLSPGVGTANGLAEEPISSTSVGQPAETVMLTSKWGYSESSYPSGSFFFYGPNFPLPSAEVEVPDCSYFQQNPNLGAGFCTSQWGVGDPIIQGVEGVTNIQAGADTGGVSFRVANKATVAWVDGHASRNDPGYLARGTNWTPTTNFSAIQMTDLTQYLWDIQ